MSEEVKFTVNGDDRTPDWSRLSVDDLRPTGTICFHGGNFTEVMRISRDGVWVNPDLNPDKAAQAVLNAIDEHIKLLVHCAVQDERKACAKVAESYEPMCDTCPSGVANAIRSRK